MEFTVDSYSGDFWFNWDSIRFDMAGAGSYAFRPIHAHILLVGWLSLFAWGVFYRIYKVRAKKLIAIIGWTGIIGAVGLTSGMWRNL